MTGDSFTYGYGLTNEQTISNMLANELNRQLHESNIEVLNTGLLSYSPDQEYRTLLTNIPRFKPNLIIWDLISWNINDMINRSQSYYRASLYDIDSNNKLVALNAKLNRLYIIDFIYKNVPRFIRNSYILDALTTVFEQSSLLSWIPDESIPELRRWSLNKLTLEAQNIQQLCQREGCKVIIVWLPTKESLIDRLPDDLLVFKKDFSDRLNKSHIMNLDLNDELATMSASMLHQQQTLRGC